MISVDSILAEVEQKGYYILKDFFTSDTLRKMQDESEWFLKNSAEWYKKIEDGHTELATVCPQTIPEKEKHRAGAIYSAFSQPLFEKICRSYLGASGHVNTFIVNRQKQNPQPITEWHADQAKDSLLSFKFMLYFNDVNEKNGAFSYFPSSHKMVRKLMHHAKQRGVPNTEIHNFEQMKKWAKEFQLPDCMEMLEKASQSIRGDYDSENVYCLSAPAGSVILFDPKGLHRGGIVREGERFLIRIHCFEYRPPTLRSKIKQMISPRRPFFEVAAAGGRTMGPIKEYG